MKLLLIEYVRGGHKYLFLWRPERTATLVRHLGTFAADPELPFDWQDAARCAVLARQRP